MYIKRTEKALKIFNNSYQQLEKWEAGEVHMRSHLHFVHVLHYCIHTCFLTSTIKMKKVN